MTMIASSKVNGVTVYLDIELEDIPYELKRKMDDQGYFFNKIKWDHISFIRERSDGKGYLDFDIYDDLSVDVEFEEGDSEDFIKKTKEVAQEVEDFIKDFVRKENIKKLNQKA